MAADRYFLFDTEAEARAFLEGVQFVNDATIEVHGLFLIPTAAASAFESADRFVVLIVDRDQAVTESEDPPDGFRSDLRKALCLG